MKSTFTLFLLVSCLTGFLVAANEADAKAVFESCISENGVSEQDFLDLKLGKTKPEDAKDNVKCSAQCMLAKFGFMNSKGKLLNDKILEYFADPPIHDRVEKALAACGDVVGANPCDTAMLIMSCMHQHFSDIMDM